MHRACIYVIPNLDEFKFTISVRYFAVAESVLSCVALFSLSKMNQSDWKYTESQAPECRFSCWSKMLEMRYTHSLETHHSWIKLNDENGN